MVLAFTEGAATGVPDFAGIPFNIELSTFLYFRAVQSIANQCEEIRAPLPPHQGDAGGVLPRGVGRWLTRLRLTVRDCLHQKSRCSIRERLKKRDRLLRAREYQWLR